MKITAVNKTQITDLTPCTKKVTISTSRYDSPGKMTFTTVEDSGIAVENGSMILFDDGEGGNFTGYVFTAKRSRDGVVDYVAYDQVRYLKAKASYTFTNMSLEQIISMIAQDFGLKVGTLAATGYVFPCLIKENESCMDIIFDALSQVIIQTGKIFVFYDQGGKLMLTEAKDLFVNILVGNESLLTEYSYKQDIDSATYNRIKLVRPNKDTGKADTYLVEDTASQAKWGLLQYYSKVNENMNAAQITDMAEKYLQYYNRELRTVSIQSMGISGLRAGMILPVRIEEVEALSQNILLLTEKVTHEYEEGKHTMKIEVKNFDQLKGVTIG